MADMGWQWRPVTLPWQASPAAAVVAGRRAHLFGISAGGGPVSQVALEPDGTGAALPDLPLISVSGAATGPDGPLIAGARVGDEAPVLCAVDAGSGKVTVFPLLAAEQTARLAAWPVPVGGDVPGAVWATGRDPATVHFCVLTGAGLVAQAAALTTRTVWSIQALPALGGVDVVYQGAGGTAYARMGSETVTADPVSVASGAVLCPGAVLTLAGPNSFSVWDTTTGTHHELTLPQPQEGGNAQVTAPRLLTELDLLVWRTDTPDVATAGLSGQHAVGSPGQPVRTVSSRGWVARLDRMRWQVGPAAELPAGSPIAVALDGRLVVTGTTGTWIGTRSMD